MPSLRPSSISPLSAATRGPTFLLPLNGAPRATLGATQRWWDLSNKLAPNKRLKLTGGDGVLCPGGHELSFTYRCAGGRVARSLSAIR